MESTKICAIPGGGGALGGTLAHVLVTRGYKVALFDTDRARARIEDVVAKLGKDNACAFVGDFADEGTWSKALAETEAAFGARPTHAAFVAGGWEGGAPLHETKDDAAYEHMMKANVDTVYRGLRALLPAMVARKAGSIVVVGSRAVPRPWTSANASAYAASKAAVTTMAEAVAAEVLPHGVRINSILPSTMDTPANRAAMPSADPSTWVSLESASGVIAFLLSDDARDVSGAAIPVYGRA